MRRNSHVQLLALLAALLALAASGLARAADTKAPVIKHTPVTSAAKGGLLEITAHIKDESEIFGATLWYRTDGAPNYQSAEMTHQTDDVWGASIAVNSDIEYWLEAYDEFGNGPARAGSPTKPFRVKVTAGGGAVAAAKPAEAAPPPPAPPPPAEAAAPPPSPATPSSDEVPLATAPVEAPAATAPTEPAADATPPPAPHKAHDDSMDDLNAVQKPPENHPTEGSIDIAAIAAAPQPPHDETPVYRQWWFITGVSAVGVAAIVTTVILLQPQPVYRNVFGATIQPQ